MAAAELDYFYEQKRNTTGLKEKDYVKVPRKVGGINLQELAFWLCKIVGNDSLCKIFVIRIGGRDLIIDRSQMISLGLLS